MVVLIVLIVTAGRIYEVRQKAKLRAPGSSDTVENRRLEAEVTRLNERIAVLERLATDPSKRLADEIDSLKTLPSKSSTQETDNAQR
jgi:hypothetical protein